MAADRATVNVKGIILPDNIKLSINGITTYDLNDVGNNNKWIYIRMQTDGTTSRDLVNTNGVHYFNSVIDYNDSFEITDETNDDVVFLLIKNTGTTDGSTASTADLYVGLSAGDTAQDSGTIVISPNEVWFARLRGETLRDINAASSSGDLSYDVYAVLDDGGVS